MSRPRDVEDDDRLAPVTPKPKPSSSSILQAFKNLTAGRSKASPSSPSTATTTSGSPPQTAHSTLSALQRHSGNTGNKSLLTDETDSTGGFEKVASSDSHYVGGPPALQQELRKLRPDNPNPVRVKAARKISLMLKDYPVANVVGVWMSGRSLIDSAEDSEEMDAAYSLLIACVRYKTLTPQERRFFFDNIPRDNSPATFSQRFKVLQEITTNGRYLDCLENVLIPLLIRLLEHCFDQALLARKRKDKDIKQSTGLTEEHHLNQVYEYTSDVIKYNSKMFGEVDLKMLVDQLLSICRKTAAESDLKKAIEIMDAIMTYSYIPDTQDLTEYLQVLCVVFCAIRGLRDLARKSTVNLLKSHHGPTTTTALLMILKRHSQPQRTVYRDAIKGSVLIFHEILSSDDSDGLPPIDTRKLVSAVRKSLDINSSRLESCALRLLLFLLQDNDPTTLLLNDKLWKNFSEIIIVSSARLQPEDRLQALSSIPTNFSSNDFHNETSKDTHACITSNQLIQCIANRLLPLAEDMDSEQKGMVMDLLMKVVNILNDETAKSLLDYYTSERLRLPSAKEWRSDCDHVYNAIVLDATRVTSIRVQALNGLHEAYHIGQVLGASGASDLIVSVLDCIRTERNLELAALLAKISGDVAVWTPDQATFDLIVDRLGTALLSWSQDSSAPSSPMQTAKEHPLARSVLLATALPESHGTYIAKALVRIFMRAVHTSAPKTEKVYDELLRIAGSPEPAPEARIICLKVLFRMRGDVNHGIFVVPSTECEKIAAALCRTAETLVLESNASPESTLTRSMQSEDHVMTRRKTASASSASGLSRTQSSGNVKAHMIPGVGRVNRPTPPLWMYPGPKGLPEDPYPWSSHLVFAHLDPERSPDISTSPRIVLKINSWLELLLFVLQNDVDWEVYSYTLAHLGAQLMNHALFTDTVPQIRLLRNIVCSQLANKSYQEPPAYTNLNKSDVAVCMYHVLTSLVSYHDQFTNNEQDDIVKMFIHGIGSRERTSEICIHGLAVCCHELPVSVSRALESLLSKLSQSVIQPQNAVHVLEFLSALGRLPELYSGFKESEFRMVFEILFRYLQASRSGWLLHNDHESTKPHATPRMRPRNGSTGSRSSIQNMEEHLPQYVLVLSYHVMTFWFMSLSMEHRPKQIPWVIQNLVYTDSQGRQVMDEQAQVTLDMMQRVAYSDRDDTESNEHFASVYDGRRHAQSWLVGLSIFTVDTASRTGASQIIRRRPSGTRYSILRPTLVRPPRHQDPIIVGKSQDIFFTEEYDGILPNDILQAFYAPQHLSPTLSFAETPIPLPDDDATHRALGLFDRISALDGHKVGIIYVGEAQYTEKEILSNVMGSADYTHFLRHIGTLTRLKDAKFNTQGLDRTNDLDGQFTFAWRDRVSELVFHVTTMMPTDLTEDPMCTNKKKHVGNDFVNIIFNNSGTPYNFDTIASAFNYVNIVITPEARASFVETRLWARDQVMKSQLEATLSHSSHNGLKLENQRDVEASSHITDVSENPYAKLNYKVTVLTAPGMPAISWAADTKTISGAALPTFVRLLALNASVFCQVWSNRESAGGTGEHFSSWRSRLREIKKLRDRHAPAHYSGEHLQFTGLDRQVSGPSQKNGTNASSNGADSHPSPRITADPRRESGLFRRASLANIFGTGGGTNLATSAASPSFGPVGDRTSWFNNNEADRASSTGSFA